MSMSGLALPSEELPHSVADLHHGLPPVEMLPVTLDLAPGTAVVAGHGTRVQVLLALCRRVGLADSAPIFAALGREGGASDEGCQEQ